MPKQKDLKRLVRARMKKTGESYTAARAQLIKKSGPAPSLYAEVAGMSDASVSKRTGRTWAEWVGVLDRAGAAFKPHREIARYVSSLGTPSWWSQMVTVGYERIRGLRDRGQRRGGGYNASKSRTFPVPVDALFGAFANARKRRRWLPVKIAVRSATPHKGMRVTWDDDSIVVLEFTSKGSAKSAVAVGHQKLPDKSGRGFDQEGLERVLRPTRSTSLVSLGEAQAEEPTPRSLHSQIATPPLTLSPEDGGEGT